MMHNVRVGAHSAWAYSVPPGTVSSVERSMARGHRLIGYGTPFLNTTRPRSVSGKPESLNVHVALTSTQAHRDLLSLF